jgi:hypothetical protein
MQDQDQAQSNHAASMSSTPWGQSSNSVDQNSHSHSHVEGGSFASPAIGGSSFGAGGAIDAGFNGATSFGAGGIGGAIGGGAGINGGIGGAIGGGINGFNSMNAGQFNSMNSNQFNSMTANGMSNGFDGGLDPSMIGGGISGGGAMSTMSQQSYSSTSVINMFQSLNSFMSQMQSNLIAGQMTQAITMQRMQTLCRYFQMAMHRASFCGQCFNVSSLIPSNWLMPAPAEHHYLLSGPEPIRWYCFQHHEPVHKLFAATPQYLRLE